MRWVLGKKYNEKDSCEFDVRSSKKKEKIWNNMFRRGDDLARWVSWDQKTFVGAEVWLAAGISRT